MAKRIKTLEKDCFDYRQKYEKCNRALLDMASDRQAQDQYVNKSARQLTQLQKLCRTLQAERNVLVDLLKEHNIERPAMPELPPEPKDIEPPPKQTDKLDIMSRNCDELKRTLAQLQNQMVALEKDKVDEKPVATNKKASKNKKSKSKSESKANVNKSTVSNTDVAVGGGDGASNASTTATKSSDSIDDKPLAELVTKVLAENPPPIEFLEKVLTSEILNDILENAANDDDLTPDTIQADTVSKANGDTEHVSETVESNVDSPANGNTITSNGTTAWLKRDFEWTPFCLIGAIMTEHILSTLSSWQNLCCSYIFIHFILILSHFFFSSFTFVALTLCSYCIIFILLC